MKGTSMPKQHPNDVANGRHPPRQFGKRLTRDQIDRRQEMLQTAEWLIYWLRREQWTPPTRDPETKVRGLVLELARLAVSGAAWRLYHASGDTLEGGTAFVDERTLSVTAAITNAGPRRISDTLLAWSRRRSDCWSCRPKPLPAHSRQE